MVILSCIVINKSGKLPSSYDTTRYFGQKHTNGYLKLYDKLKEQKLSVSPQGSPHLTRVEFTLRPKDNTGMIYQELQQYRFDLDKSYDIGSLDVIDDITVKCMAISLTYGHIKRAELPRRQKDLITKELTRVGNKLRIDKLLNKHWVKCMAISLTYGHIKRAELPRRQKDLITKELTRVGNKLRIDKLLNKHWNGLLNSVSQWFGESKDYTKNYAVFGTEQRELTEDERLLFESFLDFNNKNLLNSVSQWFGESKDYTKNYAVFGTEQRELTEDERLLFESFLDFNNKKEHKKSLHGVATE